MPLIRGKKAKTKKGIAKNIEKEIKAGRKPSQAKAIAYTVAGRSNRRKQ